ncbi:hypothetical protein BWQ96_02262 [Gracilariopsis chorda]|uniref:Uncharacterized protein n=1 Tax=Gracilariopsis chorda TaxID=448386 RepID=A0A2V3J0D6_9FLOR|nr:hypothetical protein BWQ96_02262 [Gracilariopsis chorda]|eukprot:PXF47876.1 hypothetical protein BWQ96_02262 [Gracilariopsis chorda]
MEVHVQGIAYNTDCNDALAPGWTFSEKAISGKVHLID